MIVNYQSEKLITLNSVTNDRTGLSSRLDSRAKWPSYERRHTASCHVQGTYHTVSCTGFLRFLRSKFPELFSKDAKCSLRYILIQLLDLPIGLAPRCFFQENLLDLTDFKVLPGPPTIFNDFPVMANAGLKFKHFPGLPGNVQILWTTHKSKKALIVTSIYLPVVYHHL